MIEKNANTHAKKIRVMKFLKFVLIAFLLLFAVSAASVLLQRNSASESVATSAYVSNKISIDRSISRENVAIRRRNGSLLTINGVVQRLLRHTNKLLRQLTRSSNESQVEMRICSFNLTNVRRIKPARILDNATLSDGLIVGQIMNLLNKDLFYFL